MILDKLVRKYNIFWIAIIICIIIVLVFISYFNIFTKKDKYQGFMSDILYVGDKKDALKLQNQLPFSSKLFLGVTPKTLSNHKVKLAKKIKKLYRDELTPREVCISLGHLEIYKEFLKTNKKFMIIFEEDAVIFPNFNQELSKLLKNLPYDFDIIKLSYQTTNQDTKSSIPRQIIRGEYGLYGSCGDTGGYIISRNGANLILQSNSKSNLVSAADDALSMIMHNRMNFRYPNSYFVYPSLVFNNSTINEDNHIRWKPTNDSISLTSSMKIVQQILNSLNIKFKVLNTQSLLLFDNSSLEKNQNLSKLDKLLQEKNIVIKYIFGKIDQIVIQGKNNIRINLFLAKKDNSLRNVRRRLKYINYDLDDPTLITTTSI